MTTHRRPAFLMLVLVIVLLAFTAVGVPATFAQDSTAEVTPEPASSTPTGPTPPAATAEVTSPPTPPTVLPEITSEATEPVSTPLPEMTAEATEPVSTPLPEMTAEATEPVSTPLPEMTAEATELPLAPLPEMTAEATEPPASPFTVEAICLVTGPAFIITNTGSDMAEPAIYVLEGVEPMVIVPTPETPVDTPADQPEDVPAELPADVPAELPAEEPAELPADELADAPADAADSAVVAEATPEAEADASLSLEVPFQLAAGESLTVSGGTSLHIGEDVYAADPECQALPILTVSVVCEFETGAAFTIENSGGPMSAEQLYTISAIDPELSGAFLLGALESVTIEAGYGVPVFTSDTLTSTLDEACLAPAEIRGVIWNDANGDGLRDEGEAGFPGIAVSMTDATGLSQTFISGTDGSYWFGLLPIATYTISVDTTTLSAPGYALTFPVEAESAAAVVTTVDGEVTLADFGFAALPTASISGGVWLETGNFGVRDAGEMGVAGALVELVDEAGAVIATVPVDTLTAAYSFTELLPGTYTVRLVQATLFTPIGVTWDLDGDLNFETAITLEAGQALTGADFGIAGTF